MEKVNIMTGMTKIQEFNQYFSSNYAYLLGFAYLRNIKEREDILHDSYLKCLKRIELSGFSGSTFLNFIRVAITNAGKNKHRDAKDTVVVDDYSHGDYEAEDDTMRQNRNLNYLNEIEEKLIQQELQEQQQREYDYDVMFKHTMAFEYVNKYFSERDKMVFKTYYVLKHRHLNYKQLALACNMSQSSVSNIIKNIKKDLRLNLMCYILTGERIMELQEKVSKVETLLQKDLRHNLGEYKSYYLLIFGRGWSGCGCQLNNLREALKQWLVKNKAILQEENQKLL